MIRYFQTNRMLQDRIKDLERTVEVITGANNVLTVELKEAKDREAKLLDKIFEVTGLNHRNQTVRDVPRNPIPLTKRNESWPQMRENLETQAKKEYWEKKKASQSQDQGALDILEKEVMGD